ncbi:hypothetical protein [Rhodanobacter sp. B04]|uniref:hypothetical protein n=1 Tax=Rhodanobacter sp. B04 TaxID=1945860 RepID=UPI0011158C2D|nr:hypothetical protein [Rhodanobacter sp. B04]
MLTSFFVSFLSALLGCGAIAIVFRLFGIAISRPRSLISDAIMLICFSAALAIGKTLSLELAFLPWQGACIAGLAGGLGFAIGQAITSRRAKA